MLKRDECDRLNPNSCLNRALSHERVFVLLARDSEAPDTIRYWAYRRVETGKNKPDDPEIVEARECARLMELEREQIRADLGKCS